MAGTDVVIHVSSGDIADWRTALTNLGNLYQDETVPTRPSDLTVVVNGDAVRFVREDVPEADRIGRIAAAGVNVAACRNDLEKSGVDPSSLVEGVDVVPSGVAELARLQDSGTTYLKLP